MRTRWNSKNARTRPPSSGELYRYQLGIVNGAELRIVE